MALSDADVITQFHLSGPSSYCDLTVSFTSFNLHTCIVILSQQLLLNLKTANTAWKFFVQEKDGHVLCAELLKRSSK